MSSSSGVSRPARRLPGTRFGGAIARRDRRVRAGRRRVRTPSSSPPARPRDPAGRRVARDQAVDVARRHQPARGPGADRGHRRRSRSLRVGHMAERARCPGDHRDRDRTEAAGPSGAVRRRHDHRAVLGARHHSPARHRGAIGRAPRGGGHRDRRDPLRPSHDQRRRVDVRGGRDRRRRLRPRPPHLGATFVGSEVAELPHSATTAIVGEVRLETLCIRCRRIRPSARCGCGCSRPATERCRAGA